MQRMFKPEPVLLMVYTVHCTLYNTREVFSVIIDWCGNVQMCKVPKSNQEWCLSLKLGDTDLRATALQEMKHNNTVL